MLEFILILEFEINKLQNDFEGGAIIKEVDF